MTPDARISAAIDILEACLGGDSAERVLTSWARGNRYAGSKDRAAIRDLVFDALRCRRSFGWLGGAGDGLPTGRQLMIGALRAAGTDPATVFGTGRFAPEALAEGEMPDADLAEAPEAVRLDCPDWLMSLFAESLGAAAPAALARQQARAPVFLRVNKRKATVSFALEVLQKDGIEARPHPLSETALEVTEGARAVARSQAYLSGLVELQDAGSQALVDLLPLDAGLEVLDYCAGGGGKSLAMAARADVAMTAHDIDAARMQDITPRASRAGVSIQCASSAELKPAYDLVLCDAPCSGSGSWARAPQAKWLLTPARLAELQSLQAEILDTAADLVAAGGTLAYATCSVFESENHAQVVAFLARRPAFSLRQERLISPLDGGDGFYVAVLQRQ